MEKGKNLSFDERKSIALEGRKKGYNCAQAVVSAFPDVLHLPMDMALKISCGFGSGGVQKTCGVMSALTLLEGARYDGSVASKAAMFKDIRSLGSEFKDSFGSLECAPIKQSPLRPSCNEVIIKGIEIYHAFLSKQ